MLLLNILVLLISLFLTPPFTIVCFVYHSHRYPIHREQLTINRSSLKSQFVLFSRTLNTSGSMYTRRVIQLSVDHRLDLLDVEIGDICVAR